MKEIILTDIGHVALSVRDFDNCRAFYGQKVGLKEIASGMTADGLHACMFRIGSSMLELWEDPTAVVVDAPFANDPSLVPAQVGHISFLAGNNDAVFAALKDKQIDPLWGPTVQPLDHAFMQRSLVEFADPNGFRIQVSEITDPRPHLDARRSAKRACIAEAAAGDLFPAFDHFSMCCTDFRATRDFYVEKLGLQELVHRANAEPGAELKPGFEQSVFGIGCTDMEMYSDAELNAVGPGTVTRIGFWSDDVDGAYQALKGNGAVLDGPPAEWSPFPGIRRVAFSLRDPDGLMLQIAQRPC